MSSTISSSSLPSLQHHYLHRLNVAVPPLQQQQKRQQPAKKRVTFSPICTLVVDTRRRDPITNHVYDRSSGNHNQEDDAKSALYYTKKDLHVIHRENESIGGFYRSLLRQKAENNNNNNYWHNHQSLASASDNGIFAPTEKLRGLELLIHPTRRKNKILAIQSILKHQALLQSIGCNSPTSSVDSDVLSSSRCSLKQISSLAEVSAKLTAWSRLVALETGRLDALAAYHGEEEYNDFLIPPPRSLSNPVTLKDLPEVSKERTGTILDSDNTTTIPSCFTKQERRVSRRVTLEEEEDEEEKNPKRRRTDIIRT